MDKLMAIIEREATWWEALEFTSDGEFHWVNRPIQEGKEYFNRSTEIYRETRDGRRFLDKRLALADGRVKRSSDVLNYDKGVTILYEPTVSGKQKLASVHHAFASENMVGESARPAPLKYSYVGQRPLHEALNDGVYSGAERTPFGECENIIFKNILWSRLPQNLRYGIHKELGVPIKVESFTGEYAEGKRHWVWEVEELKTVQGHPWAARSRLTTFTSDGSIARTIDYKTQDIKFNGPMAGKFAIDVQAGVETHDTIAHKVINAPRNKQVAKTAVDGSAGIPLPAMAPRSLMSDVSIVSLALGGALVCVGLFIWATRRGS